MENCKHEWEQEWRHYVKFHYVGEYFSVTTDKLCLLCGASKGERPSNTSLKLSEIENLSENDYHSVVRLIKQLTKAQDYKKRLQEELTKIEGYLKDEDPEEIAAYWEGKRDMLRKLLEELE